MKHKFVFLSVVVVLALAMLACSIGDKTPTAVAPTDAPVKTEAPTEAPTDAPAKTEPPTQGGTGELTVVSGERSKVVRRPAVERRGGQPNHPTDR